MPQLAIIIVSWNVRDLLGRCLATLRASLAGSGIGNEVIVVDNASTDGTAAFVRSHYPDVQLIESPTNLGFAGGNNLGLRCVLTRPQPPEFLFLLNPDTEIVGDAIVRLVRRMQQNPGIAVLGPLLRYPDGSIQSSRRRFPTAGTFFWESTPLEWRWPANPWARRYRMAEHSDAEQQVDWLVGAALLVRRCAIEQAGLLDAGFALYSEELEWQRRLGRYGQIVYDPGAEIIHHEGQSSTQIPTRRLILFHTSRLRYIRMQHGRTLEQLVRLFLRGAYGLELGLETTKWLLGHRRALRRQRMDTYWALLGSLSII